MHEMTLDLRFAGAPEILARDDDAVERIVAEHALVSADDLPVFERERVERAAKLRVGKDEWGGDAGAPPARFRPGARLQVAHRQGADERETGERSVGLSVELGSVGNDRSQPIAEYGPEV